MNYCLAADFVEASVRHLSSRDALHTILALSGLTAGGMSRRGWINHLRSSSLNR